MSTTQIERRTQTFNPSFIAKRIALGLHQFFNAISPSVWYTGGVIDQIADDKIQMETANIKGDVSIIQRVKFNLNAHQEAFAKVGRFKPLAYYLNRLFKS